MAEIVRIADIKQRVVATKAKLSAASPEGPHVGTRLLDLLEAVEKTLLHNQAQIRRLRRTGKALAFLALLGWLAAAALVADRFYGNSTTGAADLAVSEPTAEPQQPDRATRHPAEIPKPGEIAGTAGPEGSRQTVDDLVLEPHAYQGRQVTVTGSVIQLFSRYRLRSETAPNTIVLDVDGLPPADRTELEAAFEESGPLGGVRARIMGRVERGDAASFHLAASALELPELRSHAS